MAQQQTLEQVEAQIEALQARRRELLLGHVKKAVEDYGYTPEELFGETPKKATQGRSKGKPKKRAGKRYADGNGNTWSGFGPMPKWLREAVEQGRDREEFRVK